MRLPTPRWWYERGRRRASPTRLLLKPVAAVWAGVTARRISSTRPFDPGVPVICVGGLTLGG
ncbi:MAG TPA: tetraacyldisaccharide 4'-kinase, partial [Caulobacteraceae bacterium]